jgi:hypothetical protein
MNLEFCEEEGLTGSFTAIGDKGDYWVTDMGNNVVHLDIHTGSSEENSIFRIGVYVSIEDAVLKANRYDDAS